MNSLHKLPLNFLGHLITLVHVAEEQSFSSAARLLGKTPSAISRTMSQLEELLQVQIFVRSRQTVGLTLAGQEIFAACKAVEGAASRVLEVCARQEQTLSGTIRIAGPMTLMKVVIAPLVQKFIRNFPNIDVQMNANDREFNLNTDQMDIILKIKNKNLNDQNFKILGEISYFLCATKNYIESHDKIDDPFDLLSHRCMHFGETEQDSYWTFRRNQQQLQIHVGSGFLINHSEALLEAVEANLGIALLPNFVAVPAMDEGRIVRILPEFEVYWSHSGSLFMQTAFSSKEPPRISAFVHYIANAMPAVVRLPQKPCSKNLSTDAFV